MSNNYDQNSFDKYDLENPQIYEKFVEFTLQAVKVMDKYSAWTVINRIRWHTDIETTSRPFKLSNNHRAYYARYFHEKYPEYDGFFRTKQLRSVA